MRYWFRPILTRLLRDLGGMRGNICNLLRWRNRSGRECFGIVHGGAQDIFGILSRRRRRRRRRDHAYRGSFGSRWLFSFDGDD